MSEDEKESSADNSVLAELEVLMRQEFFNKGLPSSPLRKTSKDEKDLSADSSVLAELEALMRQEFFPQSLPRVSGPPGGAENPSGLNISFGGGGGKNYIYRTFETKDSIRLFQLRPGGLNDPIQGRLIHVSLNSKPKYEAVSYSWGSPAIHHHIFTNDGLIPITASVQSALTRLRFQDRTRVLWIDALCINQRDEEEKSEQILLMPKIYSLPSRVVVHLGQHSDGSDLAIKLVEKIAKTSFNSLENKFLSDSALTTFGLPDGGAKTWKAFRKFWARPWFRRMWIIQEFLLARDVTIICGEWEGSWEIFLEACAKISDFKLVQRNVDGLWDIKEALEATVGSMTMFMMCQQRVTANDNQYTVHLLTLLLELDQTMLKGPRYGRPAVKALATFVKQNPVFPMIFSALRQNETFDTFTFFGIPRTKPGIAKFPGYPLIEMIERSEAAEATDPRDRLFALLSLANDLDEEELQLLRPNYKEDVKSVVCKYASVLVRKGHHLEVLYNAFLQPCPYHLPSWMANWVTPVLPTTIKVSIATRGEGIYKAAGNLTQKARMGDAPDVLIVSGGLVDTIERVGLGPIMERLAGPFLPTIANIALSDADRIFDGLSSYPTGESIFEVKWRTLIANKSEFGEEAPRSYGNLYKAWREQIKGKTLAMTDDDINAVAPEEFLYALSYVSNHKLCKTRSGYVGLVPTSAGVGDHVCIISGGIIPFILRDSVEGMFRVVGGCYIHGMMKGEALKFPHWHQKDLKLH